DPPAAGQRSAAKLHERRGPDRPRAGPARRPADGAAGPEGGPRQERGANQRGLGGGGPGSQGPPRPVGRAAQAGATPKPTAPAAAPTRTNPYVGPRAIESGEALFGRDTETVDLLNQVIADRVVLMYAVSGAGKTSLLKAGLLPGLESRGFEPLPIVQVRDEPPRGFAGNRYTLSVLSRLEAARPERERLPVPVCQGLTLEKYLADR